MGKIDSILQGIDPNYIPKSMDQEASEFISYWKWHLVLEIAEFYMIEGLLSQPVTDLVRFSAYYTANIKRLQEKSEVVQKELEEFFKCYIFVACVGEGRYKGKFRISNEYYRWIPKGICGSNSRSEVWKKAFSVYSNQPKTLLDRSLCLYELFTAENWSDGGYGGERWGKIINHLIKYLNNEMGRKEFIDTAIAMVHNGSLFVDKIIGGNHVCMLASILNVKFNAKNCSVLCAGLVGAFSDADEGVSHEYTAYLTSNYEQFSLWVVQQ